jgi:hypothetical protein
MNKKYLYIIIGVLVIVILCLSTYKTSNEIAFNDKELIFYDFGKIDKGKTQTYNCIFKYVNKKYDSLRVYGVKDGCDCTESKTKNGVYRRNDTVFVNTNYNPNKYKDLGNVTKEVFLITDKNISKFDTILPLILKANVN